MNIPQLSKVQRHQIGSDVQPKLEIKNIIAVGSGKGGVGKSTVAVNLALALAKMGAKVALLDADIYGPSLPTMLNGQGIKAATTENKLVPVMLHGLQSMSIGFLVEEQSPLVWRGPMVSGALLQLFNDTNWQQCDFMIVDLPPGTGDIQLTMAQKLPITAAVVVTTPQNVATADAQKACNMFTKVKIPVLGIVENMSWHQCPQCGHHDKLFGENGGKELAVQQNVPLLGQLPLNGQVQHNMDCGNPPIIAEPDSPWVEPFWQLAVNVADKIATLPVNNKLKLANVVTA